jgi:hypothetical protein
MRTFFFRVPALMCGVICLVALLGSIRNTSWWQPIFYAFLPACFLYLSSLLLRMQNELVRLRRRIARLEAEKQGEVPLPPEREARADQD